MEPLKERSSNYLHPGLAHDHNQPRRKSFSEVSSGVGGLISPIAHSFPRRRSYVVGFEGSLVPTDLVLAKGRRKSWFVDLGKGDAALTGSGGKSGEGAQDQLLQNGTNPSSRVRRVSLVTDVEKLQPGGEAAMKRLREQVEVMQKPSREAQKSFTWDATVGPGISVDANAGQPRKSAMSHDTALKLLGLSGGQNKTRAGVSRTVEDFTEQEVIKAFQGECQTQALRGETGKMRETHEAYQVILKVIRVKNRFLRRRTARRESSDIEAALTVSSAATVFKKNI